VGEDEEVLAMLRLDESYNEQEIELTVGQQFEIELPANPELHFHWRFESNGWPVCELQDDYFDESLRLQTSGGSCTWLFQARQPGSTTIKLVYEGDEHSTRLSTRHFSLQVKVTP
jgi:predicted secreted protein